jgi:hypothetical protein
MLKKLTSIARNTLTALWAVAALLMLASGYSDRLSPEHGAWVSTLGLAFPIIMAANMLFLLIFITFCWRRAWLPVAAFVLAYQPISLYVPLLLDGSFVVLTPLLLCHRPTFHRHFGGYEVVHSLNDDRLLGQETFYLCEVVRLDARKISVYVGQIIGNHLIVGACRA